MILLDTVALVRIATQHGVEPEAEQMIRAAEAADGLCLSAISAWELCMLEKTTHTGPLIGGNGADFLALARQLTGLRVISLDAHTAIESRRLPGDFHKDPADRFIIATARILKLTVVTTDRAILDYAAQGHVNAIAC